MRSLGVEISIRFVWNENTGFTQTNMDGMGDVDVMDGAATDETGRPRSYDFAQDKLRVALQGCFLRLLCQFQKVGEDLFSAFSQNRFGVELDAPDGMGFVADAHDFAFGFGFGGDLEGFRHGVALDE